MAKTSKRMAAIAAKVDRNKFYPIDEALSLVKEFATAKFDESIDVSVQLGIDAKKSDQVVRGAVVLPAGTGKSVRVAVFAQGDKAEQAKAAGAEVVGMEDLADAIKAGNIDFDILIASPDTMRLVGALGQILGPRGLMPNPKVGTVTPDVATAVKNAKAGQVQFRVDKAGIVHATIGRSCIVGCFNKSKASNKQGCLFKKDRRKQHDGCWCACRSIFIAISLIAEAKKELWVDCLFIQTVEHQRPLVGESP